MGVSNRPPGVRKVGTGRCVARRPPRARLFKGPPWRVEKPPAGRVPRRGPKGPLPMSLPCLTKIKSRKFKEAFNMIDQNRDGFIDHDDLKDMLASLDKDVSDDYLDDMMNQAPGAINFTMFLTLFGERLQGTDPEDVIRNAFACFDEANVGTL